jgi:O-antigen ligase
MAAGVALAFGLYLLLTSTVSTLPGLWPYDAKRLLELALLALVFLAPVLNSSVRSSVNGLLAATPRPVKLAILVFFLLGFISATMNKTSTPHWFASLSEVSLLALLVFAVYILGACRQLGGVLFDRVAIGAMALTGLAVGTQELTGVLAAHAAGTDFNFQTSLFRFSWPRFYNQMQTWMIPVMLALPLMFPGKRLAAVVCITVLGLHWYIILFTGARGSFLALAAALVFAVLFLPLQRRLVLRWHLPGFLLGAVLFGLVLISFEWRAEQAVDTGSVISLRDTDAGKRGALPGGETSFYRQSVGRPMAHSSGRIWMWKRALRETRQHPWLGLGPHNYPCTLRAGHGHPHNFPLQIAAEWGLPAAVAGLLVICWVVLRATLLVRRRETLEPDRSRLEGGLVTSVVASLLLACLSGVLIMPASQVTGLLVAGLLLGSLGERAAPRRSSRAGWLAVTALAFCFALSAFARYEFQNLAGRDPGIPQDGVMHPRLWQDSMECRKYVDE